MKEVVQVKRGRGRPKKVVAPVVPKIKTIKPTYIYKSVGLDQNVIQKINALRARLSEQLGFKVSYSDAVGHLLKIAESK
jgi:hypothetical protein